MIWVILILLITLFGGLEIKMNFVSDMWRSLHVECDNCKEGRIHLDREEVQPNFTTINIYKCDRCGKEFI